MSRCVGWSKVIEALEQLAFVNQVLGEKFKVKSYTAAAEAVRNEEARLLQAAKTSGDPSVAILSSVSQVANLPGIGKSITSKIDELLQTGVIKILVESQKLPVVGAVRNLTAVHGIGPRKAQEMFDSKGMSTVEALKSAASAGQVELTDAQKLGLQHFDDINLRIPRAEIAQFEDIMRRTTRASLGDHFTLDVCGSYRRGLSTSGDVDALVAISPSSKEASNPSVVNNAAKCAVHELVRELHSQKPSLLVGTLASGTTKFMGVGRLKGGLPVRRIDIRYVAPVSYPTALLYFTGSKSFNIYMRSLAHGKGLILNEYGLYKLDTSSKKKLEKPLESQRIKGIQTEADVFDAIGLAYVDPKDRK